MHLFISGPRLTGSPGLEHAVLGGRKKELEEAQRTGPLTKANLIPSSVSQGVPTGYRAGHVGAGQDALFYRVETA